MKRREEGGGVEWRRGECIQCYPKMYVCKAARNTDISDTLSDGLVLSNYYAPSPPQGTLPTATPFEKYTPASQQVLTSLWNRRGHKIHSF